jgi:hypothetical protein
LKEEEKIKVTQVKSIVENGDEKQKPTKSWKKQFC